MKHMSLGICCTGEFASLMDQNLQEKTWIHLDIPKFHGTDEAQQGATAFHQRNQKFCDIISSVWWCSACSVQLAWHWHWQLHQAPSTLKISIKTLWKQPLMYWLVPVPIPKSVNHFWGFVLRRMTFWSPWLLISQRSNGETMETCRANRCESTFIASQIVPERSCWSFSLSQISQTEALAGIELFNYMHCISSLYIKPFWVPQIA